MSFLGHKNKWYILLFIFFYLVYFVGLVLKIYKWSVHWLMSNYLNDLLCLPLFLYTATWLLRVYFNRTTLQLDKWQILFALVVISVVFEWLAPLKYPMHTGDIWDVMVYTIGAIAFWKTQKYEFVKS
jgi:hypothetical protein